MKLNNKNEKIKSANTPFIKINLKSVDNVSELAENVINTVRDPLLVLDKELRVVKASRSFYDFFKVSADETIGKIIYEIDNHQWNIPKLKKLLEKILPKKHSWITMKLYSTFLQSVIALCFLMPSKLTGQLVKIK